MQSQMKKKLFRMEIKNLRKRMGLFQLKRQKFCVFFMFWRQNSDLFEKNISHLKCFNVINTECVCRRKSCWNFYIMLCNETKKRMSKN